MSYKYRRSEPEFTVAQSVAAIALFAAFVVVIVALLGAVLALAWNWVAPYFGYSTVDVLFGIGFVILFTVPILLVRWALNR